MDLEYVYRVVGVPGVAGRRYVTPVGAKRAAGYYRHFGYPDAKVQIARTMFYDLLAVGDAGTNTESSTGPSRNDATGPFSPVGQVIVQGPPA